MTLSSSHFKQPQLEPEYTGDCQDNHSQSPSTVTAASARLSADLNNVMIVSLSVGDCLDAGSPSRNVRDRAPWRSVNF